MESISFSNETSDAFFIVPRNKGERRDLWSCGKTNFPNNFSFLIQDGDNSHIVELGELKQRDKVVSLAVGYRGRSCSSWELAKSGIITTHILIKNNLDHPILGQLANKQVLFILCEDNICGISERPIYKCLKSSVLETVTKYTSLRAL